MSLEGVRKADLGIYLDGYGYDKPKKIWQFMRDLIASDGRTGGASVLDVGCAAGAFVNYLASQFPDWRFSGIDVVPELIADAAQRMPNGHFLAGSILDSALFQDRCHDVVLCNGTVQIFDDLDLPLGNLVNSLKAGGSLFIHTLINDEPIDMLTRYRYADREGAEWEKGWNVFSRVTFERSLRTTGRAMEISWHPFHIDTPLPRQADPMRSFTMPTQADPYQRVNGAGILVNTAVLHARLID